MKINQLFLDKCLTTNKEGDEKFYDNIRLDFVYFIEKIQNKELNHANKYLQDTIMNYFLDNDVADILR